jgi:hypothetical protein
MWENKEEAVKGGFLLLVAGLLSTIFGIAAMSIALSVSSNMMICIIHPGWSVGLILGSGAVEGVLIIKGGGMMVSALELKKINVIKLFLAFLLIGIPAVILGIVFFQNLVLIPGAISIGIGFTFLSPFISIIFYVLIDLEG